MKTEKEYQSQPNVNVNVQASDRVVRCVGIEESHLSVKVLYFPEADVYMVGGVRCLERWVAEHTVWDTEGCTFAEAKAKVEDARMDGFRDLRDIQAVARC
jgi:hypothetical protein